jgi:hypothetical protein
VIKFKVRNSNDLYLETEGVITRIAYPSGVFKQRASDACDWMKSYKPEVLGPSLLPNEN